MKSSKSNDSPTPKTLPAPTVISNIFDCDDVEPNEKLVYLALVKHVSKTTGLCFPGKSTLARETGYSKATIDTHIASLVAKGYVVLAAKGGGRKSNTYLLPEVVEWIEESKKNKEKEPISALAVPDISSNQINNNINVNNNVNNNITESQLNPTEKQPISVANTTDVIKESIGYNKIRAELADTPELAQLLDLTVSVACTNADNPHDCRLGSKKISANQIRTRMLSLTQDQVRYVVSAYAGLPKKPDTEHQQGYILSMLYYSDQHAKHVDVPDKQPTDSNPNRFHNFHQRDDYDYDELEKQLLINQGFLPAKPEN